MQEVDKESKKLLCAMVMNALCMIVGLRKSDMLIESRSEICFTAAEG